MSSVMLLPPHVADLIAAGEVVERPASAVKELIENSIDADARNITVEIRSGGALYLRVTDDGIGMSPSDAGTAFLRHATSKLRDASGLEAIASLGFRGEALAAIAAVSRIELTTRERGAPLGVRVSLDRGDILKMEEAGCPEGTTIIVRDLFFNTPARRKFLKSDRAEAMACAAAALRVALGRPDISIRFIKDGVEEFFTPGDGRPLSAIYSLFGRDFASGLLAAASSGNISVEGFVSSPARGRGNRSAQYFFVNGRAVKSQKLQAALETAYKNTLLTGRYPQCVLYIRLSHAHVDVNVHPTKAEVKFSDERAAFDAVYGAVRSALEAESRPANLSLRPETEDGAAALLARPSGYGDARPRESARPADSLTAFPGTPPSPRAVFEDAPQREDRLSIREPRELHSFRPQRQLSIEPPDGEALPALQAALPIDAAGDFRLAGEVLGTYIIAEREGEVVLIDKHAAHERVIFDRLTAGGYRPAAQSLLVSVTVTPPEGGAELLMKNAGPLEELGIVIEEFGDNSVIVRAVPADTDAADAEAMLEELAEVLAGGGGFEGMRDEVFYTIACKAAIKAGRASEEAENRTLAAKVLRGQVKYCPHGRPVALTLTKKELDRHFRR